MDIHGTTELPLMSEIYTFPSIESRCGKTVGVRTIYITQPIVTELGSVMSQLALLDLQVRMQRESMRARGQYTYTYSRIGFVPRSVWLVSVIGY